MWRFTRLTNAFSKKLEMHAHSVALHSMHYNFVKIHQSLLMTPAPDRLWEVSDLVALFGALRIYHERHYPHRSLHSRRHRSRIGNHNRWAVRPTLVCRTFQAKR